MELFDALLSRWEADLFLRSSLASLASFCLWAKILAYSAVAWRFFSARLRLSARRCLLRCNMIGVTRRWTFGAAYFCFLPSLRGRGRLITYWHTLSSFDKLNSFLKYKNKCVRNNLKFFNVVIFYGIVTYDHSWQLPDFRCSFWTKTTWDGVIGKPGDFTISLLYNSNGENGELTINNASTNWFAFSLSCLSCSVAWVTLAEEETNSSLGKNTLFHGETLLVVTSCDSEDVSIPFFSQGSSIDFCSHSFLIERANLRIRQKKFYFI